MQRKIEQLVSGQARKVASPQHPLHFLLYSSNKHLEEDSKYVDLQVGKQVWYSVPRRMRQELWLSVLHKHKGAGAQAAKQYATLVRQALPVDVDADIEKDVGRTFPNAARFATEAGKLSLLRVLRAYAVYDTEVGYCQGMNFLAGLLLTWMPNEATAFGGLVVLMQQRLLRDLYKSDLAQLQVYLWQFSKLLPARLERHMEGHGVLPVLYLSSWLLTSFGSDFPLFFSSRVLDVVLTGSYPNAVLKVATTLLKHCEKALLALDDMEEVVHYLKAEVPNWSREVLQDILSDALSQAWTPAQEAILSDAAGMETVIDAVGRVNAAAQNSIAQLAEVSQQAEQAQRSTSTASSTLGMATPPKHPVPVHQPSGSSPLPPAPGKPLLPSMRSASWSARLKALPTSPSLPVPVSPAPIERDRRHTTEEAAHHSSPAETNAAQRHPASRQLAERQMADRPSAGVQAPDRQLGHSQSAAVLQRHTEYGTAVEPNSISSTPVKHRASAENAQTCETPPLLDLLSCTQHSATAETASSFVDLLSFHADPATQEDLGRGHAQHQAGNGLLHLGSSQGSSHQSLDHSIHAQTSLADTQELDFPQNMAHVKDDSRQQQSSEDPYCHATGASHALPHSGRHLSGITGLDESQGSDLDSWGSFLLPDESSNMMAESLHGSLNEPVMLLHAISSVSLSEHPAASLCDNSAAALPTPLSVTSGGQSLLNDSSLSSPNACITRKQRLQLDLFLQSSSSKE